jgi:hypothetical protein
MNSMVERYDFYRVDNSRSRRRGVLGSRQRTRVAKRARGALSGFVVASMADLPSICRSLP